MESPVFGVQAKQRWKDIYGVAWAASVIFDKIERIADDIRQNQNVANLTNVLQDMPQTEMLVSSFLRNLPPIILDMVDMITLKPVSLVSKLSRFVRCGFTPGDLVLQNFESDGRSAFADICYRRVQSARADVALRPEREHRRRHRAEERKSRGRASDREHRLQPGTLYQGVDRSTVNSECSKTGELNYGTLHLSCVRDTLYSELRPIVRNHA